jgi:CRP-like cAMP-binding protein
MADPNADLLKRSDMFNGLSTEELERVLALGEAQGFSEGQVIVKEDEQGRTCYFILSGRVDIEIRSAFPGRDPQRIATIKRGEMFGELSLVDGFLRSATARALDEVEVMAFDNARLEGLMEEDPKIGYRIMRNIANVLSSRMRTTNMKLRNALSDVLYY